MKKLTISLGALLALAGVAVMAADAPGKVLINGKTYVVKKSQTKAPVANKVQARNLLEVPVGDEPGVYAGDVVELPEGGMPAATLSGALTVRPSSSGVATALASEYGLQLRSSVGGILLLQAKPGTEMADLAARLKLDKRVRQVKLELVDNRMQAQ